MTPPGDHDVQIPDSDYLALLVDYHAGWLGQKLERIFTISNWTITLLTAAAGWVVAIESGKVAAVNW